MGASFLIGSIMIGSPTIVKSNILVRSMGPFSEHRMVIFHKSSFIRYRYDM